MKDKMILPTPKSVVFHGGETLISGVSCAYEGWTEQAALLCEKLSGITGKTYGEGNVILVRDEKLESGACRIEGTAAAVKLLASDTKGICCAISVVLQLAYQNGGAVPAMTLYDKADCEYRGMMVDLARTWHPLEYLLRYVDMCFWYRMSTLHLHFTDSQSYTLPSDVFPKLPSENRHYTRDEIVYINEYAAVRGIEIMPEIDVPGHSDPFASNYPEIFGTNGIIGFDADVFAAFEKLLVELCDMFPNSRYIHIGGDEAAIGNWLKDEKSVAYAESLELIHGDDLDRERIYATFVQKLADIILAHGKTPIVWEGFAKEVNDLVSRDVIVMSWENFYQTTPNLVDAGFTLINCSWSPMYVVYPIRYWEQEDVYNWDIYTFRPVHPDSPYVNTDLVIDPTPQMIGGQLLAWGDRLPADRGSLDTECSLLAQRLAACAQNTWNKEKVFGYDEFTAAYKAVSSYLKW